MATPKQVSYALVLMARAGFPTRYMGREHKELGAGMRERSGSVEGWLQKMSVGDASALIDKLKGMVGEPAHEER